MAAANIDGVTIHSIFAIPVQSRKQDYQQLSNEILAVMRNEFRRLKILVIDEISMVGHDTLMYVHRRLQDIMGTTDPDEYFGDVSVFAVGNLYLVSHQI